MAHAPPPTIEPKTGLWGFGFRLESLSNTFYDLYATIKDIWLIGSYLAWPFYIISTYLGLSRDLVWQADDAIVYAKTWVRGIVEGNTLLEIIATLAWNLHWLRVDPVGCIWYYFRAISVQMRQFVDNPDGWLRVKIQTNFPELFNIIYNPSSWVYQIIQRFWPTLLAFLYDPIGTMISWILLPFPFIRDLQVNPTGTIIGWLLYSYAWFITFLNNPTQFLIDRLSAFSPTFYDFIVNPVSWFRRKISETLNISEDGLSNFPLAIIRSIHKLFHTSPTSLRDTLADLICDMILLFV